MSYNQILLLIIAGLIVLMSLIAFITYCVDKNLAIKGKERIKEKTLLFMAIFFGALGSFIGRIVAHHKTDKIYFSITIWFALIMQAISLVVLTVLAFM